MNYKVNLYEYSHNIITGVQKLFGHVCPLCCQTNEFKGLCKLCFDLVAASMQNNHKRCTVCLLIMENDVCAACSDNKPSFKKLIAAFDYQPYGDLLIYRYKIQKQFWLAALLTDLLYKAIMPYINELPQDLIVVPIPSSNQSLAKRGFNPPALVAKNLAKKLKLRYAPNCLQRIHDGAKQSNLDKSQRHANVAQLYSINTDVKGANIVLVDDIFTTGSTANAVARLFSQSGANSVYVWVLARTPIKNYV